MNGVQNNEWRYAVYKAITLDNCVKNDVTRKMRSEHGEKEWDGLGMIWKGWGVGRNAIGCYGKGKEKNGMEWDGMEWDGMGLAAMGCF